MNAQEAAAEALKPSAEAKEKALQDAGLLPFQHPVSEEARAATKKRPIDWAVQKELAKLNRDKSLHYTTHTPWQYRCAEVVHRWPDPEIDPTFVLTEEEFEEAIEAAVAGRSLESHREEKKREKAKLEKVAEQLDANNTALAEAAAANAVPELEAPAAAEAQPVSDELDANNTARKRAPKSS